VGCLTVLLSAFLLLVLGQLGIIAYTGGGWLVNALNLISGYLGYSILFFIPALLGYCWFFIQLHTNLSRYESLSPEIIDTWTPEAEKIRFYNGGMDLLIIIFFGIGVIFTAWGLQNALVAALGSVGKSEAARMGAWGILKRLVDNGILIALWTTIVGGGGGYLMRLAKYIFLGKKLNRFAMRSQDAEKQRFFQTLESIEAHVEQIEKGMHTAVSEG